MSFSRKNALLGLILLLILNVQSCSREKEDSKSEESMKQEAPSGERMAQVAAPKAKSVSEKFEVSEELGRGFLAKPFEKSKERLLEYKVSLTYETKDLRDSRQKLLELIAKYGYLKTGTSSAEYQNPYMTADIFIKSDQLYEALRDFDNLGKLLNEQIIVIDHTENMVLADRKARREQMRIARKNISREQISSAAKNWKDVDDSLERSENEFDRNDHEKWKIKDKVAWAEIHFNLKGPEKADDIKLPKYSNAFIGLLNFLLKLVYILIWLVPFIFVFLAVWYYRGKISAIFKKKK